MTVRAQTGSLVALTFLFFRCQALVSDDVIKIPDEGYRVNNMSRLMFFKTPQSWNTARHICHLRGGDLLSPASPYLVDIIKAFAINDSVWKGVWDHTWTALYQQANDVYAWSDRQCRRVGSPGLWKDAKQLDPSSKRCFQLNKDNFVWEREDCSTKKKFICDIKTGPCSLAYQSSPFRVVESEDVAPLMDECLVDCHNIEDCFLAAYDSANSTCHYLLAGGADTRVAEKQCFQGAVDETNTDSLRPADAALTQPSICTLAPLAASSSSTLPPSSSLEPSTASAWEASSPSLSPSAECPVSILVSTVFQTDYVTTVVTSTETQATTQVLHSTAVLTTTLTTTTVVTATSLVPCQQTTVLVSATPPLQTVTVTASPSQTCDVTTQVVPTTVTVASVSLVTSCQVTVTPECDVTTMTSSSSSVFVTSSVASPSTSLYPSSSPTTPRPETPGVVEDAPDVSLVCANVSVANVTLDSVLAALRSQLTIDRKNTSMAARRYFSVPDHRVSSKTIGFSAIFVCVIPLILVLAVDVPVLYRDLKNMLTTLLACCGCRRGSVDDGDD